MHRIKRPQEPDAFLEYRLQNPAERNWDTFSSMTAYHEARKTLYHNQDGLCAYCEARLPWDEEHGEPKAGRMRIEHFHAKADPDPTHNWMLDWSNLMMVCMSSGKKDARHCDARKEDVQNGTIHVANVPAGFAFEGYILNPYEMPNECLFRYDMKDGSLHPDDVVCNQIAVQGNKHATTATLVDSTIKVLNLSACKHLCRQRQMVQKEYERLRASLKSEAIRANRSRDDLIAERWFGNNRTPSFFTTRRCLLKGKAEPYILNR